MCETFQLDRISDISIENIEFDEESGKYVTRRQVKLMDLLYKKKARLSNIKCIITKSDKIINKTAVLASYEAVRG